MKSSQLKRVVAKLLESLPKAHLSYLSFNNSLIKECFKEKGDKKILNIGCGETRYGSNYINLDIALTKEVDIVADAHYLPFKDKTFDFIFCGAVLEHVKRPFYVVEEIYRVLTPGGELFITIPFLYPFHVSIGTKDDYFRVTKEACKELFGKFRIQKIGITAGPASAFCLVTYGLVETILIKIIKNPTLIGMVMIPVSWLLYPIKYLDKILIKLPEAHKYAAMFYVVANKGEK